MTTASCNDDVFMIANAFRKACEEDTRETLNAMAGQKTPLSLQDLKFYVVPASWMRRAYPMLSVRARLQGNNSNDNGDDDSWRETIGMITNAELLAPDDHAVSSSSDEEDKDGHCNGHGNNNNNGSSSSSLRHQHHNHHHHNLNNGKSNKPAKLRPGLEHGRDFFLLGANAWFLVQQKFGSDQVELARPCVLHESQESSLAVALDGCSSGKRGDEQQLVSIPPTGRFPYETLIQTDQQQQEEISKVGDVVSEDEDGEPNDLFPDASAPNQGEDTVMGGDSQSPAAAATSQNNVLLLPPSSTLANASSNASLYPNVQDMDCNGSTADMQEKKPAALDNENANTPFIPAARSARKRHGTGLGNLGNTCFMNSTIQCLAHTDPLRRYFLSGEFMQDLNRDNPLGTGGELTTDFAKLLADMWGTNLPNDQSAIVSTLGSKYSTYSDAIYPRDFKFTLGKHASQFVGYDQHDSHELATYLLDALHEDTNRVTTKPYIEKPEKDEENETDAVAAKKAWDLHLKREDSRVLENFMGLIKSRVQCCKEGCGRVSTTFDPCMYLSVPLPGSTERTLPVIFVPLDPQQRKKTLSVTMSKTAKMGKLTKKVVEQLMKGGFSVEGRDFELDNFVLADIWNNEVWSWYSHDDDCDNVRDTDTTVMYEVKPHSELKNSVKSSASAEDVMHQDQLVESRLEAIDHPVRYKLSVQESLNLHGEKWKDALESYVTMPPMQLAKVLNEKRGTNTERFELFQVIEEFVESCHQEAVKASNKRAREDENEPVNDDEHTLPSPQAPSETDEPIFVSSEAEDDAMLIERCETSTTFENVKTRFDLSVLEHCASKLRRMIESSIKSGKRKKSETCLIWVSIKLCSQKIGHPLVLRIPATMNVYELREELSKRLARSLRLKQPLEKSKIGTAAGIENAPAEVDVIPMEGDSHYGDDDDDEQPVNIESMRVTASEASTSGGEDPAFLILRQVPLTCKSKSKYGRNLGGEENKLGSLELKSSSSVDDGSNPINLASLTDEDEMELVSDAVGSLGHVIMNWPRELFSRVFDEGEYDCSEEIKDPEEEEAAAARTRKANKHVTVLDCVENFCQEEQLEESEMWYCNKCKEHVRAWKKYDIYQAPPILIIQLKRFQYSGSTHRREKINTFIDFPLEDLDLSDIVMSWEEGQKPVYDCYGVSNHFGGLGGGHYTAYCLNDDGIWCNYDDTRITENVDPKEVVSDAAYVLYYRRRDVVVDHDFWENIERLPAIVADNMENKVRTPSVASSTNAAQGDEMELEIQSNASSTAYSASPMESDNDVKSEESEFQGSVCEHSDADVEGEDNSASFPLQ